jgi:hypothetical protein
MKVLGTNESNGMARAHSVDTGTGTRHIGLRGDQCFEYDFEKGVWVEIGLVQYAEIVASEIEGK